MKKPFSDSLKKRTSEPSGFQSGAVLERKGHARQDLGRKEDNRNSEGGIRGSMTIVREGSVFTLSELLSDRSNYFPIHFCSLNF